jgi:hypothetical protein
LNFVKRSSTCYATGDKCLLSEEGEFARNEDKTCPLQGRFDVWVAQDNRILVTDLGFPSDDPKQCLALGISEKLSREIASRRSRQLGTEALTTERKCVNCGQPYWYSNHRANTGRAEIGRGYFCPECIVGQDDVDMIAKLGSLRYWCG